MRDLMGDGRGCYPTPVVAASRFLTDCSADPHQAGGKRSVYEWSRARYALGVSPDELGERALKDPNE
jgi:hypothetical protein